MAKKTAAPKQAKPASKFRSPSGNYWLVKSEPDVFSIDDLMDAPNQATYWDGVRNYQARNTLRDLMKLGDYVLFYHSNADPPSVVGITQIIRTGYPDHTAQDSKDPHFDPKSSPENPIWYMVDVKFVEKFCCPLSLESLRKIPELKKMVLLQKGSRLSVQPVQQLEFDTIVQLGRG